MKFHRLLAGTAVAALMAAERRDPIEGDNGIEGYGGLIEGHGIGVETTSIHPIENRV